MQKSGRKLTLRRWKAVLDCSGVPLLGPVGAFHMMLGNSFFQGMHTVSINTVARRLECVCFNLSGFCLSTTARHDYLEHVVLCTAIYHTTKFLFVRFLSACLLPRWRRQRQRVYFWTTQKTSLYCSCHSYQPCLL